MRQTYRANINSFHDKFIKSAFLESFFSFTTLSQLNFLCFSFTTNQLEIHISICAGSKHLTRLHG